MPTLYFDCFSGISGDMTIAALLDLGVPRRHLETELRKLGLSDRYRLQVERGRQRNIAGLKCTVDIRAPANRRSGRAGQSHSPAHSHDSTLAGIRSRIEGSKLSPFVRRHAINLFRRIAVAEGRIHGIPVGKVHFHEVGAIDSIVDMVGVCILLEALAPKQVLASVPCDGQGTIECEHGRFPVPTPATLELLKGIPIRQIPVEGELITPTGAAILAEFAQSFGPMPTMALQQIGYGLGSRQYPDHPNVLRIFQGKAQGTQTATEAEVVEVIETNVDDISAEVLAAATEDLLAAGALDAFLTPVIMKKGRPATLVTVLARPADAPRLAELLLAETGSFGLRFHRTNRLCLDREIRRVRTPLGPVDMKLGRLGGRFLTAKPEFESCRTLARKLRVPVRRVWAAAMAESPRLLKPH